MHRIAAIWRVSPLRIVGVVFSLAIAVGIASGSGANFNARTANPDNILTAGNLTMSNSKDGSAILSTLRMKPGDTSTGTVDIKNTGDIPGVFTLAQSALTNTPSSPALSAKLDLKVEDLGDPTSPNSSPPVKYTGKLGSLPSTALGTFAAGDTHRYRFTVTFPDGGSGGADNAYRGGATSAQFDWESTSS